MKRKRSDIVVETLLAGDEAAAYRALHADITAVLKPRDITERLLVQDYVDDSWAIQRMRRYIAGLQMEALRNRIQHRIHSSCDNNQYGKELVQKAAMNDAKAVAEVKELLGPLEFQAILANAYKDEIETLERFDRLIANAEDRRDSVRHELERWRSRPADQVPDAGAEAVRPQTLSAAA
jgi:hypothetical protein